MDSPPPAPPASAPAPQQLTDLVQSLEQAARLAKQLPSTTDASHRRLIFASLHSAHLSLSSFLSLNHSSPPGDGGHTPEESSVDQVEKMLRDFNIQNKRTKRSLSPSAVAMAELHRTAEREAKETPAIDFDPHWTALSPLDLVHQFNC